MSWGDTFSRHKATGMDPSAAAFVADQGEPARKKKADKDEAIRLLSAAIDLCIHMMNDNGLHLPHTIEKARDAQAFAGTYPSPQSINEPASALVDVPAVESEPVAMDRGKAADAAVKANHAFGQWMPERWLHLFLDAYEGKI